MTRVLVVWEDTYFAPLGLFVERLVRKRMPSGETPPIEVLHHTARSNGAFERYVSSTWAMASRNGLPGNPGSIGHLVCVVDGDKLHELRRDVPPPPEDPDRVAAWHAKAEHLWETFLRAGCSSGGPPVGTVHGMVLRWSRESLLLAGHDLPAMGTHLEIDTRHERVGRLLSDCKPPVVGVKNAAFTDTFRQPMGCINRLREACGRSEVHKNSPQIDDALRAMAREHLAVVSERAPDIRRIADRVWQLHDPPGVALATPLSAKKVRGKKSPPVR